MKYISNRYKKGVVPKYGFCSNKIITNHNQIKPNVNHVTECVSLLSSRSPPLQCLVKLSLSKWRHNSGDT